MRGSAAGSTMSVDAHGYLGRVYRGPVVALLASGREGDARRQQRGTTSPPAAAPGCQQRLRSSEEIGQIVNKVRGELDGL